MLECEKTISTKQLALVAFMMISVSKCFTLPLAFLKVGGRSAWLPLVMFLVTDLIVLGMLLTVSALQPNKTAFGLIKERFGKTAAKIIITAIVVYLTVKTVLLIFDFIGFISAELFDGIPRAILLFPLTVLLAVFGIRSIRAIGRTAEILIYLVLAALVIILFLLYGSANFMRIFPLFGDTGANVAAPFMRFPFAFGDLTALYIVLGQTKRVKRTTATVSVAAATGAAVALVYAVLVFSAYADVSRFADTQNAGVLTQTSIARFSLGRFDKLAYTVFAAGILVTLAVWFHAAVRGAQDVTETKKPVWPSIGLAAAVYITAVFSDTHLAYDIIVRIGIYITPLFAFGFPLLLFILALLGRKKKSDEKSE